MSETIQYGGQAVMEGVMMRGPRKVAVAVRNPRGEIVVEEKTLQPWWEKFPIFKRPILRGFLALIEAMVLGIKMLTFSANISMDEDEEELSIFELIITIGAAVGLAVLLFIVLPTVIVHYSGKYLTPFWQNLLEGIIRIVVFLGYVLAISFLKDIRRVFEYHGAEHKVIHAFEAGEDISRVENIQKYSTLHPRCGTAFLLIVMVLTIFFFSFLGSPGLFYRILSRILLLPLIAGAAYEIIKISAKYTDKAFIHLLILPGLWLQKLTTREPDASQLEVAMRALAAVLPPEEKIEIPSPQG
ncbi:MAG: DUF1385 domain-containing protein [Clostridia bacterium]|nr:DUF1385 domain-containing protein [Clostridia bacterium]